MTYFISVRPWVCEVAGAFLSSVNRLRENESKIGKAWDIHLTTLRPYIGKCIEHMRQLVRWDVLWLMISAVYRPFWEWILSFRSTNRQCVYEYENLPVDKIRHSSVTRTMLLLHVGLQSEVIINVYVRVRRETIDRNRNRRRGW